MNTTLLTVIILFLLGFLSDIFLQLNKNRSGINLFSPYWITYGPIGAAIIAGLITLIFGGLFLLLAIGVYNYFNLDIKSWSFVFFSTALAFVLGVIVDVLTNYNDWLGSSLRLWYDTMGPTNAALWSGGLTFAFTAFFASLAIKLKLK